MTAEGSASSTTVGSPLRGSIVFFHGLTSSPAELQSLADSLRRDRFGVATPPLAGHDDIASLRRTRLGTWLTDARAAYESAAAENSGGPLFVGGLSFGALLALYLATIPDNCVAGVVMLAPPFRLRRRFDEARLRMLASLPDAVIDSLGVRAKQRAREAKLALPRTCLHTHSVGSAVRMVQLRTKLLASVRSLQVPVLIVQDPHDHIVHPDGVDPFIEAAEEAEVDTIWLPGGEHELTLGPRYTEVSTTVIEFLNRLCLAK